MAQKKGGGSTRNGRDSQPKMLGVKATVLSHGKHDKVRIFKMRRRKHYQKHGGHRQTYTELQIGSLVVA